MFVPINWNLCTSKVFFFLSRKKVIKEKNKEGRTERKNEWRKEVRQAGRKRVIKTWSAQPASWDGCILHQGTRVSSQPWRLAPAVHWCYPREKTVMAQVIESLLPMGALDWLPSSRLGPWLNFHHFRHLGNKLADAPKKKCITQLHFFSYELFLEAPLHAFPRVPYLCSAKCRESCRHSLVWKNHFLLGCLAVCQTGAFPLEPGCDFPLR